MQSSLIQKMMGNKLSGLFARPLGAIAGLTLIIALVELLITAIIWIIAIPLGMSTAYWGVINALLLIFTVPAVLYFMVMRKMQQEQHEWQDLVEQAADLISTYDIQGRCISVNPVVTEVLGYTPEEYLCFGMRDLVHPDDLVKLAHPDEQAKLKLLREGKLTINAQRRLRHKNGNYITFDIHVKRLSDGRIQSIKRDVSYRQKLEEALHRAAHHDPLTGLPNRVLLADRMRLGIAKANRENIKLALCLIDLDGFKPINDDFGHEVGDQVLVEIASRISMTIRAVDTIARLGGDEFVVLLAGVAHEDELKATMERLLAAIAQPINLNGKSLSLGASIGVCYYQQGNDEPDVLIRQADQAMYSAKRAGKNRFCIFDGLSQQREISMDS